MFKVGDKVIINTKTKELTGYNGCLGQVDCIYPPNSQIWPLIRVFIQDNRGAFFHELFTEKELILLNGIQRAKGIINE
jgi:hypothetical protein